jgi:hypothetical protein
VVVVVVIGAGVAAIVSPGRSKSLKELSEKLSLRSIPLLALNSVFLVITTNPIKLFNKE